MYISTHQQSYQHPRFLVNNTDKDNVRTWLQRHEYNGKPFLKHSSRPPTATVELFNGKSIPMNKNEIVSSPTKNRDNAQMRVTLQKKCGDQRKDTYLMLPTTVQNENANVQYPWQRKHLILKQQSKVTAMRPQQQNKKKCKRMFRQHVQH